MTDIDLDTLSTPEHGYTVDDRDDDPVSSTGRAITLKPGASAKRARINAMRYVLANTDYDDNNDEVVDEPDPQIVGRALTD
jgi:hypothetical protein